MNTEQWGQVEKKDATREEAHIQKLVTHVIADAFSENIFGGKKARLEVGNLGFKNVGADNKPEALPIGWADQKQQPAVQVDEKHPTVKTTEIHSIEA